MHRDLLATPNADDALSREPEVLARLRALVDSVSCAALEGRDPIALLDFHRTLHDAIALRFSNHVNPNELSVQLFAVMSTLLRRWLASETSRLDVGGLEGLDRAQFERWFVEMTAKHPVIDHPVYAFLAERAGPSAFRHFVIQESTVDAPFADLIAACQLGAAPEAKLGMAANYWDEMGSGDIGGVHAVLFSDLLRALDVGNIDFHELSWSALACGNLLAGLAMHRSYHQLSIGALAVTELGVPVRFAHLVRAAERLGSPPAVQSYYRTHVECDDGHAQGWLERVVLPTIDSDPLAAARIATGVLLRLESSKNYCTELHSTLRARTPPREQPFAHPAITGPP